MNKSKVVLLIEDIANQYIAQDWPQRKDPYLSADFILVAMMKLADTPHTEGIFADFSSAELWEMKLLRKSLSQRKIRFSRDDVRSSSPCPDQAADEHRQKLERIAYSNSRRDGNKELIAHFYLDAICALPSDSLRKVMDQSQGESAIGKMYSLSRQKQELRETLLSKVIGQEDAVNTFADGVTASMFFDKDSDDPRPRGIFVFAGPPGVGKTFLAQTAADTLGLPVKRFDMSEYIHADDSVFRLIGTDPTWRGRHEGELTSFVKTCNAQNTGCFLIFDEIEKAHPDVINLFLQLLDAGRLTDKYSGHTVSFAEAYIVFTTNAGRSLYENGKQPPRGLSKSLIIDALREDKKSDGKSFFPDAILSRFESGHTVMFRHLSAGDLVDIGRKEMLRNARKFQQTYGPEVLIDPEIPFLLLLQKGGESDARSFRADCQRFVRNNLLSISDCVHEQTLNTVLRQKNRIRFTVHRQQRQQLQQLYPADPGPKTLWFIIEDREHLDQFNHAFQDYFDDYQPLFFPTAGDAVKALKAGLQEPAAILFDLKTESDDRNATQYFADKNPLIASIYQDFSDFMDYVSAEAPMIPICVFLQDWAGGHVILEEAAAKKGAAVFSYAYIDESLCEPFFAHLESRAPILQLQKTAFCFARERKALSFTVSPNEEADAVAIRLANFRKITLTSGGDTEHMLTSDRMPNVTFRDYIGGDAVKSEMQEFISYLKNPAASFAAGYTPPKGVLLYGPPGTGKTFLAKAMANEAGVPFFFANGSSFVSEYTGSGPKSVRKLFDTARKYAPSIVFIDEIDAIAKKRTGLQGNHPEESTLNMLLSQMDGFDTDRKRPVFVIAATNYSIDPNAAMTLDPALVRRFTRTIFVDLPNRQERRDYLVHGLSGQGYLSEEFLDSMATRTVGMNYGNLQNVIDKALRDARKMGSVLTEAILDDALETILFGEKKDWGADNLERTAWHEAGHAFMCFCCGQIPEYVTITARGNFGGYVMPASTEEKPLLTREDILNQVKICLAGRAAELLRYGNPGGLSTGPSGDIQQAGHMLTSYVCRFGMDDQLGLVYVPDPQNPPPEIRQRVHALLAQTEAQVLAELTRHQATLQRFVQQLLERNKLTAQQIQQLLTEVK